jgi:hypothetical protein
MSTTPEDTEYSKGDRSTVGDMVTNMTPGVKSIQAAYSRAGATDHHTPGAASKLGSEEQHERNEIAYRSLNNKSSSNEVRQCSIQQEDFKVLTQF